MDEQTLMRIYGNIDLPEGTPDRPLVTFALFAYNQEKFVREAVEGALSQVYSPLEIILSDDNSLDKTFEIMQEIVSGYRGPHKVVLRKNRQNLGLIGHVNFVLDMAAGLYIVLAAGDDISFPNRTSQLIKAMLTNDADLAHSNVSYISDKGDPIQDYVRIRPTLYRKAKLSTIATSMSLYQGASAAFSRRMVRKFGPINHPQAYEDLVYGFRAAIGNGYVLVPDALLNYRLNVGISQKRSKIMTRKEIRSSVIQNRLAVLHQRLTDINIHKPQEVHVIHALQQEILCYKLAHRRLTGESPLLDDGERILNIASAILNTFIRRIISLPPRLIVAALRGAATVRRSRYFQP